MKTQAVVHEVILSERACALLRVHLQFIAGKDQVAQTNISRAT